MSRPLTPLLFLFTIPAHNSIHLTLISSGVSPKRECAPIKVQKSMILCFSSGTLDGRDGQVPISCHWCAAGVRVIVRHVNPLQQQCHSTRGILNTTQHNRTQHNRTQHKNTTQHNTIQHNTTQHTQHNTTQHDTTHHNTTQHDTSQHNTTQHSTTQHNTTSVHLLPRASPIFVPVYVRLHVETCRELVALFSARVYQRRGSLTHKLPVIFGSNGKLIIFFVRPSRWDYVSGLACNFSRPRLLPEPA